MGASGILPVLKPKGPTSHDVVDELRRLYREKRVGHAGTLDPMASGVLLVGVGKATRILRYYHLLDKCYEATIAFGAGTDTLDAEGKVIERAPADFDPDALEKALSRFRGELYQIPPMVSALKQGGEPLYKKALRGELATRSPRKQRIYELFLSAPLRRCADGLLRASVRVVCDSGTYVRVLAADIAKALGTVGYLESLIRTSIGPFDLDHCYTLEELASLSQDERLAKLLWDTKAVPHLPIVMLDGKKALAVSQGKALELTPALACSIAVETTRVLDSIPHLRESLADCEMLSIAPGDTQGRHEVSHNSTSSHRSSRGRSASESGVEPSGDALARGVRLEDRTWYVGPVALVGPEGRLAAIVRPAGGILAFDCVLV